MELKGSIKFIGSTTQVTDSFKKRDLVITTEEQYPQHILIEFGQDKCDIIDKYKVGETVEVGINLRGREWTNPKDGAVKYFNSIQGWKIGYAGAHADAIEGQKHQAETYVNDGDDDLPF